MGIFFQCFRIRNNRTSCPNLYSDPLLPKSREAVASRTRLSSVYDAHCVESEVFRSLEPGTDQRGLKDEAKFLKACGTLLETPIEIRNAKRLEGSPSHEKDSNTSEFHSRHPIKPDTKFHLNDQPDRVLSPLKLYGKMELAPDSSGITPSSHVSDGCENEPNSEIITTSSWGGLGLNDVSISIDSSNSSIVNLQYRKVHFECETNTPPDLSSNTGSLDILSQPSNKTRPWKNHCVSKPSPYPTPLKLDDDMQTPGTVFPANMENSANDKKIRIRSQYVYSVLNPAENFSRCNIPKEEDSNSDHVSIQPSESHAQPRKETWKFELGGKENSKPEDLRIEASFSAWLKPPPSKQYEKNRHSMPGSKIPGSKPIIGTVAGHWSVEECPEESPKWWDRNGIPNSTNKYKEDQKVSWHATPFEERLEKALSEGNVISQIGGPLVFDENAECDKSISNINSVISC